MKNSMNLSISILISTLLLFIATTNAGEINYNRTGARDYAAKHCGAEGSGTTYNFTQYKCYNGDLSECENYGQDNDGDGEVDHVDCANFASQSMIAGGLSFGCVGSADIVGKDDSTKGETSVSQLKSALTKSFCFEVITDTSKAKEGDILSANSYSHVMIYSGEERNGKAVFYAHTNDRCGSSISWSDVTIYHFKDDEKCKKCERDESTCEAEMKDKCSKCYICNSDTGTCDPKCPNSGGGRCEPKEDCDSETGSCITSQGGDCPDDTLTVGTGVISQSTPLTSSSASVGVLEAGFTYDMVGLLESFKESARIIKRGDISPELVKDVPLLIIPSAGLYGMENSEFFKNALNEYVNQGGTILVLSQQHGYEYFVLPGGLSGYGWLEDQSCQSNSSYIDTWHNVLAGQTKSTPSLNVDGYFTKYPENTTVLLRRTANGQPAVLMYQYGSGYVIASTVYTDTAYTRGESSEDERKLIRDIITWAKSPATLTEIKPGETITANLTIANNDTSKTATAAEIELYDPDRKEVKLRTKALVNLAPGQSTQIPITYTTASTDPTGVYHIKYDLLTEGYELLTSEMEPEGVNIRS